MQSNAMWSSSSDPHQLETTSPSTAEGCSIDDDDKASAIDAEDNNEERPEMYPIQPKAKVFACTATTASRNLAHDVKASAMRTACIHGTSTTGTPWLFARRLKCIVNQNRTFLSWCRHWIKDCYGTESCLVRVDATEPHIVKYDHKKAQRRKRKDRKNFDKKGKTFDGIGTHLDGSFVTCIMSLSEADEFTGGGTYFPSLGTTIRLNAGEVLLFQGQQGPYSAPHRAQPITGGRRILYLAFFKLRTKKKNSLNKRKKKKKKKKRKSLQ